METMFGSLGFKIAVIKIAAKLLEWWFEKKARQKQQNWNALTGDTIFNND